MKKLILFATLLMLASGCYTVVEVQRSYPDYRVSRFNNASQYASDLDDTTLTYFDAYRTGYQDAQLDYARFRDEQRWLRWNQWQLWGPGFGTTPLFWSYNDYFWDPYFYWSSWAMPGWQWRTGWYGMGWGGGIGMGVGWNSWGWGNWAWYPPVVVIQPGNGVTDNRVRGPRGSGRTTVGQVNVDPSMASPTLTPGLVNPATFGPTGVIQTGKGNGEEPGRRARTVEGSENATRGSNVSRTERSNASGGRSSGRSESSSGSVSTSSGSSGSSGKSSSSGSTSGGSSSGRRPRGN
jgi:hypothetical protein